MSNSATTEISKLYRVRRTVIQMLDDRGYNVDTALKECTLDQFVSDYGSPHDAHDIRDQITVMASRKDDPTIKTLVFFAKAVESKKKIGIAELKNYANRMQDINTKDAIIVVNTDITPFAKKALNSLKSKDGINIEIFQESSLLVNITEHVLVPKHKVLSEAEKKELLTRYKLKPTQLPRIRPDDPVARYYGLQLGQVVKIVRPSETAGKYVTYRYVSKQF